MVNNFNVLRNVFYFSILCLFVIRGFHGLLLHQIWGNPVFFTSKDLLFITIANTPLLKAFVQHISTAYFVDIMLFGSIAATLLLPKYRIFPILSTVSLFLYAIVYYSTHGVHHNFAGLIFMSIPFIFVNKNIRWQGFAWVRITVLWIYFSAGLWKVFRGAFTYSGYFSTIIKEHYGLPMMTYPESFMNKIRWFLVHQVSISDALFKCLVIIELMMCIAFFTRRFDKYIALVGILITTLTWILADTYFFDFAPVFLVFLIKPKHIDLTIQRFMSFTKRSIIALATLFLHLLLFFYGIYFIYQKDYTRNFYSIFPFQNYYMYSVPYSKSELKFIEIKSLDVCLNCSPQLPPQREIINANLLMYVRNNKENDIHLEWIIAQISKTYEDDFSAVNFVTYTISDKTTDRNRYKLKTREQIYFK